MPCHLPCISIIGQGCGLLVLLFVPGLIIVSILKLNTLKTSSIILYSLGLSLIFLYGIGIISTVIVHYVRGIRQFSPPFLLLLIGVSLCILLIILYHVNYSFSMTFSLPVPTFQKNRLFYVISILPAATIFGTYLQNYYSVNTVLLVILVLIAFMPLLAHMKILTPAVYPGAIFIISLSLLFHSSLMTPYIVGWDTGMEYAVFKQVMQNGFWDPTGSLTNFNAMLSVVFLPEVLSSLLNLEAKWIYKIIYPFIFAFLPVILYETYHTQLAENDAFLASFAFMSIFTFYTECVGLPRQQIAEVFLALLFFTTMNLTFNRAHKLLLISFFGFGVIVSHYGTAGLFALAIAVFPVIYMLIKDRCAQAGNFPKVSMLIYLVVMIFWYSIISQGQVLKSYIIIAGNIFSKIVSGAILQSAQPIQLISRQELSPLLSGIKLLNMVLIAFITLGVLSIILRRYGKEFYREFVVFSLSFFALFLMCIGIPLFASQMNTMRMYHISLMFLAPFGIVGMRMATNVINQLIANIPQFPKRNSKTIMNALIPFFFLILFLLNSGIISEFSGDEPISISLNKRAYTLSCHGETDEYAVVWLGTHIDQENTVQGSWTHGYVALLPSFYRFSNGSITNPIPFSGKSTQITDYVFVSYREMIYDEIITEVSSDFSKPRELGRYQSSTFAQVINSHDIVYSSGGSEIAWNG